MNKQRLLNMGFVFCLGAAVPYAQAEDSIDKDLAQGVQAFERADIMGALAPLERAAQKGYPKAQYLLGYIMERGEENAVAYQWFLKASEQGHADSQIALSDMIFQQKPGIKHDKALALHWLKQAADSGALLAINRLAWIHAEGRYGFDVDEPAAVALFQQGAEAGDEGAITKLASAYKNGELGLPVDPARAAEWTARSSKAKQP